MKRTTCSNEVFLIVKKKEEKRSICVHEPKQTGGIILVVSCFAISPGGICHEASRLLQADNRNTKGEAKQFNTKLNLNWEN